MSNGGERLFDPALLFRMQLRPVKTDLKFGQQGWQLPPEAELPSTGSSISGQGQFARLKLAVSETGLFMSASVTGKRQLPWCRESRLEDSDGLHIWIDTRNSRDVHRATRYCHRFVFAPLGRGPKSDGACCCSVHAAANPLMPAPMMTTRWPAGAPCVCGLGVLSILDAPPLPRSCASPAIMLAPPPGRRS